MTDLQKPLPPPPQYVQRGAPTWMCLLFLVPGVFGCCALEAYVIARFIDLVL